MKIFKQNQPLYGEVTLPGDKSISHRAVIVASQAEGISEIRNLSNCLDVHKTITSLLQSGTKITRNSKTTYVHSEGLANFNFLDNSLYIGNSGTATRLLMGLFASSQYKLTFYGDSLAETRPISRLIEPLSLMGATFTTESDDILPLTMIGNIDLKAINYKLNIPSSQVKSAILLAALNVKGTTILTESQRTRNHTEIILKYFGADITIKDNIVSITGQKKLTPKIIDIPGDPSSAAFITVAALCIADSCICLKNICINQQRIGFYNILRQMGANIEFQNIRNTYGEEVADIKICASKLKGINIPPELAPSMIDEYPILAIACSFASGATVMYGIDELKYKESNRMDAIFIELSKCGIEVERGDDWIAIKGTNGHIKGGVSVACHRDHRMSMSLIVAGLISEDGLEIDDIDIINTSFPEFFSILKELNCTIYDKELVL